MLTAAMMAAASTNAFGQTRTLSGHVVDARTGESVAFASCADPETGRGTTTNSYGFFSLEAAPGTRLTISCMGYDPVELKAAQWADSSMVIRLKPKDLTLDEVTVSATVPQVEMTQMSKSSVPVALVRAMPSFSGEPDVMKAITFLPGVSAGRDGMSDIFVRGGDRGQNLILLDGMKIYNSNHLFGLVSLFNTDIVRNVDVFKGIFPAEYGGRLASVINVLSRDGNTEERHHHLSVGMLSSTLSSEGPIGGGRLTYSLAARAGYNDLFNMAAKRDFNDLDFNAPSTYNSMNSNYVSDSFYDINGRVRWRVSPTASLTLSTIIGSDFERWGEAIGMREVADREVGRTAIRNNAASLAFSKSFTRVFWRTQASLTSYRNTTQSDTDTRNLANKELTHSGMRHISELQDLSLNSRVEADAGICHMKGGAEVSRYAFRPSRMKFYDIDAKGVRRDSTSAAGGKVRSVEASLYADNEMRLTSRWSLDAGLRATAYHVDDTTCIRLEPRLSTRFLISPRLSVKAGYSSSNQFNHAILNYVGEVESEAWMAATRQMPPQHADQWAAGLFFADDERRINISIEGFYKKMSHLLHFRSMKVLDSGGKTLDKGVSTDGDGRAYGLELMASKDFDHGVSLNAAYTLQVSERRFANINGGRWFPFLFDRKHQLTLVALWKINKLWDASATFNLASGNPFTMPTARVRGDMASDFSYLVYTDINNRRTPAYHRLDLNASREHTGRRGVRMKWSMNIYNAYAHKNPSRVKYGGRDSKAEVESDYSILPSLSYSIWF